MKSILEDPLGSDVMDAVDGEEVDNCGAGSHQSVTLFPPICDEALEGLLCDSCIFAGSNPALPQCLPSRGHFPLPCREWMLSVPVVSLTVV